MIIATLNYVLLVIRAILCVLGNDEEPQNAVLMAGLSDIKQETRNEKVTVDSGTVPEWINGNFIRHGCGTFGMTDNMDDTEPNYIQHLFDCVETGTKFKLEKGQVTFTNRMYDTLANDFLNQYGRDMTKSSVFLPEAFSKVNTSQTRKFFEFVRNSSISQLVPHVSWCKIGNQAVAMSEFPSGVIIDPDSVELKGQVNYPDGNFGYGKDVIFTNNPAHPQEEKDGTIWSTVAAQRFVSRTRLNSWRIVYKMDSTGMRKIVGEYHYESADLSKCSHGPTSVPYPNMKSRFGYMHSFAMTKQYIILPEAAYLHDPCVYTHYQKREAFFPQNFRYESDGFSRLLVMRKSDGAFIASIETKPFFTTHQLGSYEDDDLIHLDMLTYSDASFFTKSTFVHSLLKNEEYYTNIIRITINTQNWDVCYKNLSRGPPASLEMPTINYAYNGQKYTYSYIVKNIWRADTNAIVKLNVDTAEENEYVYGDGMFAQEPQFIHRHNPTSEDDGVLLVQGIDGINDKAFLTVIDAKTMTLISKVTATGDARFGLHVRFYGLDVWKPATSRSVLVLNGHFDIIIVLIGLTQLCLNFLTC